MKTKFLFSGLLFVSLLFAFGCQPTPTEVPPPGPGPGPGPGPEPEEVTYTISADKTEVDINEEVTFTVKSSTGEDVTAKWQLCDDKVCFPEGNKIKWSTPGTYLVKAQLSSDPQKITENKVEIAVTGSVFVLSADKLVIFERESVTFKVTEVKDGVELEKLPANFQVGIKDGDRFKTMENIFPVAGVYTIDAWKLNYTTGEIGVRSDNTLEIIVKKREATGYNDNFYRRSLISEYTGTWCNNCPELVAVLEYAEKFLLPDRFITAAFHWYGNHPLYDQKDACEVEYTKPVEYQSDFGLATYPSYVIDWNKNYAANHKSGTTTALAGALVHSVGASQARYASELTPGIAIDTKLNGRNLNIKVKMTPKEDAKYYLGLLFVEDNMETYQNGGNLPCNKPDEHKAGCKHMIQMNVVHKSITKGATKYEIDQLGKLTAKQEYIYDYNLNDIAARYNLANCRVIAYVCKADASILPEGYFCANAATVKVGSSIDYEYEPIYE